MELVLYLASGFVLLWKGGDMLVDGADAFARSHGVPPTLAGVFILGFGTSLPELAVTALAALDGEAGIAVGNVAGSNIANIALVLGVSASIALVAVNRFILFFEMPVCILASVLAYVLVSDGSVGRSDGIMLLAAFGAYAGFALATVRHRDAHEGETPPKRAWFDLSRAVVAMAAVVGGAKLFTTGAVLAADAVGVSGTVIGLTLVALGTSLPELSTAIAAARKRKMDLVIGNLIGSNIFNVLLVLGVAGTIVDQDVQARVPQLDMPIVLGLALVPFLVALVRRRKIERPVGVLLLACYFAYVALLSRY
jgi:cation:H+ antiporter